MLNLSAIICVLLNLVLSNTIPSTEVHINSSQDTNTSVVDDSISTKQIKTKQELVNEALLKLKPLPGSHFDENYRVIIDDPEVYQRALDEEKANSKNPIPESNEVKPEYEFKLFSWETLIGGIIGAVILFSSILICQINDYYKRKK